jgi:hypothetical protein
MQSCASLTTSSSGNHKSATPPENWRTDDPRTAVSGPAYLANGTSPAGCSAHDRAPWAAQATIRRADPGPGRRSDCHRPGVHGTRAGSGAGVSSRRTQSGRIGSCSVAPSSRVAAHRLLRSRARLTSSDGHCYAQNGGSWPVQLVARRAQARLCRMRAEITLDCEVAAGQASSGYGLENR